MELLPWISRGQVWAGSETWLTEYIGKGKGVQEVWTFLRNETLKSQEQAISMPGKVRLAGEKSSVAEQRAASGTQGEKESLWPWEIGQETQFLLSSPLSFAGRELESPKLSWNSVWLVQ